ncbi:nucleoside hydrolase [Bosea sp. (in: a-proteobacteria)]|jgi:purine nucleosidase|uniref:nucleoside hydrolase n=1 Tax=Bosea sp. (in: a-proteobacteria) TaxID=1871050 RepID=UPI003F6E6F4A
MTARPIIIDTDPGQDDAVALLLAFAQPEALDIRLISTVAGNVGLDLTTANALRIRDLAGRADVPVQAGMAQPMLEALETAEFVSGPDGLSGAGLPPPASSAAPGHAVQAIVDILRAAPDAGITLCALGPLSNVAMALRLAPELAPKLREIVIMGGAMGLGNMTPAAEFNFYVDPHAAAVVLSAGIRTTLFGLHVTHQALAPAEAMARLKALDTRSGRAVHGMLTRPRPGGLGTAAHPMHDPCVIAWLLWPELFKGRHCHVGIELAGNVRGRSTIDWNGRTKRSANAFVVSEVDAEKLFARMIDALARLP